MASVHEKKEIYSTPNNFIDRSFQEREDFPELVVRLQTIDTALLLFNSEEEAVLVTVFKHITEFLRKQEENIEVVREKNVLDLLVDKELYANNTSTIVRRFSLYIASTLLETMNTLQDLDTAKTTRIMDNCLHSYLQESDDYCLEYLSVMLNKCTEDPQVARQLLPIDEYHVKLFELLRNTINPDILLHSTLTLHKLLLLLSPEQLQEYVTNELFPMDRMLCELTNEFVEVRSAALKVIKTLIVDTGLDSPFAVGTRATYVLQQLTRLLCDEKMAENIDEVVDTLSMALHNEYMTQLFFEHNLFDQVVSQMGRHEECHGFKAKCKLLAIYAEAAKYQQFLYRLYTAAITEHFLLCLLTEEEGGVVAGIFPSTHVLVGLNRLLKLTEAANRIVASYEHGVVKVLLQLIEHMDAPIKTREQSADLLCNLLTFSYHPTATGLFDANVPNVVARVFEQGLHQLSIDLVLSLLYLIESLAQNNEYRSELSECTPLAYQMAILLKNSFNTAIVVSNLFRCFCTLIDEENFRHVLHSNFLTNSIKRALKSLSNLVKTAVTNFIMQTTRFPDYVQSYIDTGVLEVLIMHQKHAMCVSTWGPAIESILSKSPTLKFSIRNHLGFTDSTVGHDFYVSKVKFEDFRVFLSILKEEVSPRTPFFLLNYQRMETPSELVTLVPHVCISGDPDVLSDEDWCYSRQPGDQMLPQYLNAVNRELERLGLLVKADKVRRCIDFENVARRAKVIAEIVAQALCENLKSLDLHAPEDCCAHTVRCHLTELRNQLHCYIIPMGMVRTGCYFERAVLFKTLADQIGLPCTLQRSVDGKFLFNELPLPVIMEEDVHCEPQTLQFMPWRMLRPTHVIDLIYNVGELYPLQSRQALQYLKMF